MTATGPYIYPGFVDAHDKVDSHLSRIKGLAHGSDDLMDGLAVLNSDDPRAQAIRAVAMSILDQAEAGLLEHQVEWDALKGPAKAA